MPSLIEFEYHRPGKDVTVYHEWLVLTRPDLKVLLLDAYAGADIVVGGARILDRGAPIIWFLFPDAWYDVGRFHLTDGTFTGWYTNLSRPVRFGKQRWVGHDLFLDLWQPYGGPPAWLDEDEFAEAVAAGILDRRMHQRVLEERARIQAHLDRRTWPPAIADAIDLPQALALRQAFPDAVAPPAAT